MGFFPYFTIEATIRFPFFSLFTVLNKNKGANFEWGRLTQRWYLPLMLHEMQPFAICHDLQRVKKMMARIYSY